MFYSQKKLLHYKEPKYISQDESREYWWDFSMETATKGSYNIVIRNGKTYYLKLIHGVLGRSLNYNITCKFLCRRPVFPDYFSVFYDYAYNKAYLLIWDHDEKYLPYYINTSKNKMERSEINVHLDETYIMAPYL